MIDVFVVKQSPCYEKRDPKVEAKWTMSLEWRLSIWVKDTKPSDTLLLFLATSTSPNYPVIRGELDKAGSDDWPFRFVSLSKQVQ